MQYYEEDALKMDINKGEIHYNKTSGFANMTGELYEVKIATLLFLRALNKGQRFLLASNMKSAGLFDDIFFKCYSVVDGKEWSNTWFIQLKHKEKANITFPSLISPKGDFSLPKYCNSFHKMENNFNDDHDLKFCGNFQDFEFVLYTNAEVTDEVQSAVTSTTYQSTSLLSSGSNKELIFSFCDGTNVGIYRAFEELLRYKAFVKELASAVEHSDKIKEKVDVFRESVKIREIANRLMKLRNEPNRAEVERLSKEMKDMGDISTYKQFLPRLTLFTGQSHEPGLDDRIRDEIQEVCHTSELGTQKVCSSLSGHMLNWWKSSNHYLCENASFWSEIKSEIKSVSEINKPSLDIVNNLGVNFFPYVINGINNFMSRAKVLNVVAEKLAIDLSSLKVHQAVESSHSQKYIFTTVKLLLNRGLEAVLYVWPSKWCSILVIICEPGCDCVDVVCDRLCSPLEYEQAKIIIVSTEGDTFAQYLKHKTKHYLEISDSCKLIHFDDKSQISIMKKNVVFQGHRVLLGSLVGSCIDIKDALSAEVLSQILKNDGEFVIGSNLPDLVNHYIPRTLECVIPISLDVLKASTLRSDICAVSGASADKLKQCVSPKEEVRYFGSYSRIISDSCRIFDLSTADDGVFNLLCSNFQAKNVHHLSWADDVLIWKITHGDPKHLIGFICKDKVCANVSDVIKFMSETNKSISCPETVLDIASRLVIVTAEPGMGKSTLLTTLAKQTKEKFPSYWVIRINLSDHQSFFAAMSVDDHDQGEVLTFLYTILGMGRSSVSNFEQILFKVSLESTGNVILLLDGFDEISPTYTEKIILLLKVLQSTSVNRLWITSRLVMKSRLENALGIVTHTLQAFTENDQKNFLTSLWSNTLTGITQESLDVFITKLQELVRYSLNDENREFSAIPLQTIMLAESLEGNLVTYNSVGALSLPENLDLLQLYDKFVEKKRNIHCREKNKRDVSRAGDVCEHEELTKQFQNNHMRSALFALLESEDLNKVLKQNTQNKVKEFLERVDEGREKTGIVHQVVDGKPQFIHRTFAEYFAAMWFSHNFDHCREFLECKLLSPNISTIRNIFDRMLAQGHELHIAVLNQNIQAVEDLLKLGTDVNKTDRGGRTPLHLAVIYSKPILSTQPDKGMDTSEVYNPIIKLLFDHFANSKITENVLCWRPIHYATVLKKWDAMDLILKEQVDNIDLTYIREKLNEKDFAQNGLYMCAEKGYFNLLECFASCGVDISQMNILHKEGMYHPLHIASRYGRHKLVRYLLSKKVSISICDKKGNTPLHFAVFEGMYIIAEYLAQRGADINGCNKEGNTPLNHIMGKGDLQTIVFLVEHLGCDINLGNKFGNTPLHRAAGSGCVQIVEYLLLRGAAIDARNSEGNTALHQATWTGNFPIVQVLIKNGANVNIRDNDGDTPLSQSAGRGNLEVVKCLVQHKADVAAHGVSGNTAFHWAARQNNVHIMEYLLAHGANINACNYYGNTPLHRAVEQGSFLAVKYLFQEGCNSRIRNNTGYCVYTIKNRLSVEEVKYIQSKKDF